MFHLQKLALKILKIIPKEFKITIDRPKRFDFFSHIKKDFI